MLQHAAFFLASLAWNLGLGMTWLAVPLYAYAQGLSNAEIGILFAVPVLAQAPLNLVGGAYTDRIGGRRILLGSCIATIAAGPVVHVRAGVLDAPRRADRVHPCPRRFLAGHLGDGERAARGARHPARAPERRDQPRPDRRHRAVRVPARRDGLRPDFRGARPDRRDRSRRRAVDRTAAAEAGPGAARPGAYLPLLRERIIGYAIMCAYLSALPFSLSMSFYPLLLAQYGYGEGPPGVLLALRAVGSILASLVAARFVRTGPQTLWPVGCGIAVAVSVGFVPTINHIVPIAFWLLVVGAGTAAMTLYFQITISEASRREERGSALALGGLGWSVSHLTTPLLMGFLADRYGIVTGFYALGALRFAVRFAMAFLRRWAFRRP